MKFGYYSDKVLPPGPSFKGNNDGAKYTLNSHGYRCPEWTPMPDGKKNVVVLGCSHTFGQGLNDDEHWVHFLSQHNTDRLRYWNLGQPGASGDKIVRILYGSEKIIDPKIIIVCWPHWSRRERLSDNATNLAGTDDLLRNENNDTDKQNFLKNVFFVEKFAEFKNSRVLHCFAQESYHTSVSDTSVMHDVTIANCWPYWDNFDPMEKTKKISVAKDGKHYGREHHERFAQLFLKRFGMKLK